MKTIFFFLLIFLGGLFFLQIQSCKYRFDKEDLSIINTYNVGDTIVFKSNSNKLDSFRITKKEIRYGGLSEGYAGNPQVCYIYYQTIPPGKMELISFSSRLRDQYSNEKSFLSAAKSNPKKPATIDIEFSGFCGEIPTKQELIMNEKFGQHYNINHFCKDCSGLDSIDIIQIHWKPNIGIIWYQKKEGTTWELVRK